MHHWGSEWDRWLHQRHPDNQRFRHILIVQAHSVHSDTENIQVGRSSTHSLVHLSCLHSHWYGHRPNERGCSFDHHNEIHFLSTPGGRSFPHLSYLHSHCARHISSEEGCSGGYYSGILPKVCTSSPHSLAHHCCPCSHQNHCTQPTVGHSGSSSYS